MQLWEQVSILSMRKTQCMWWQANSAAIAKDSIFLQRQKQSTSSYAVTTNTIFSNSLCGNLAAERKVLERTHRVPCCVISRQSIRSTKLNYAQRSCFIFGDFILPRSKTSLNDSSKHT